MPVNTVSFRVEPGEIFGLIGPNGAGKTTLVHLVSGMIVPDGGTVVFAGQDVTRLPMHRRAALGLVRSFQITHLFLHLTALENAALAVQSRTRDWGSSFRFWRPTTAEFPLMAEAAQTLERVGLGHRAQVPAGSLSHGEQRCLELGMALATRPRMLLLDEPMAGMGPEESQRMIELIAGLKGRLAMLLIEHDMDVVFRLADCLSVLVAGRVIASGAPAAVREDPAVRRAYLGDEVVPL